MFCEINGDEASTAKVVADDVLLELVTVDHMADGDGAGTKRLQFTTSIPMSLALTPVFPSNASTAANTTCVTSNHILTNQFKLPN